MTMFLLFLEESAARDTGGGNHNLLLIIPVVGLTLVLGFLVWLVKSASQGKAPVGRVHDYEEEEEEGADVVPETEAERTDPGPEDTQGPRQSRQARRRRKQLRGRQRVESEEVPVTSENENSPGAPNAEDKDDELSEEQKQKEKELEEWAAKISVSGEGTQTLTPAQDEELNSRIRADLEQHKIVDIAQCASRHSINIHNCIRRIEKMKEKSLIQGLFDDRGRFILVTEEEMRDVAAYIAEEGRISAKSLVNKSNELVDASRTE